MMKKLFNWKFRTKVVSTYPGDMWIMNQTWIRAGLGA